MWRNGLRAMITMAFVGAGGAGAQSLGEVYLGNEDGPILIPHLLCGHRQVERRLTFDLR